MDPVYMRPQTVAAALAELNEWQDCASVLAGGTDLLVQMKDGALQPEAIVDISALGELHQICQVGYSIEIGALVTFREIEQHSDLAKAAGVIVQACREVGSVQIRNRGTLGGNLDNASPAGDSIPALYVLDAQVELVGADSSRWVPVGEFFTGPGQTLRRRDELITRVRFEALPEGTYSFFYKVGQRRAVTISKVSAAGTLLLRDGVVERCRLALGAVASTVIALPEVEEFLQGQALTSQIVEQAADLAAEACSPIDDIRSTVAYRKHLVRTLITRGLLM